MRLLGKYSTFARESMLSVAVNAAAAGHNLSGFQPVEDSDGRPDGYQARCELCGMTAWVGENSVHYSLLDDVCPGKDAN